MRVVTIVSNNDGGHGAIIHADLSAAKDWARNWALGPECEPPLEEIKRKRVEADIDAVTLDVCLVEGVATSDAWKEWIYFARFVEAADE